MPKKNEVFKKNEQKKSVSHNPLDFQIPSEPVPLPSNGLVYSQNHPLSKKQEVDCRLMTASEEDLLMNRALIKSGKLISALLKACIVSKDVDPDDLVAGDRSTLLVAIRAMSYGEEYKVALNCPACDSQFDFEVSLNKLPLKRLKREPIIPHSNLFSVKLPKTKWEVNYRLLTGHDDVAISRESEMRTKKGLQESYVLSRLMRSIVSINGEEDRSKIAQMIRSMPAMDSLAWRRDYEEVEPGLEMKQEAVCSVCGEISEFGIPLNANFFFPAT